MGFNATVSLSSSDVGSAGGYGGLSFSATMNGLNGLSAGMGGSRRKRRVLFTQQQVLVFNFYLIKNFYLNFRLLN